MPAPVRIELKERYPWYWQGLLLMFALVLLTAAGWLFYHRAAMGAGWFLPVMPLIPGAGAAVVFLYQCYGQKYLLMSREVTSYHFRFFGIGRAREFSTRRCSLSVKSRLLRDQDEAGVLMYAVLLSADGLQQELAEFHSETKAVQLCKQIEQQRDMFLS